MKFKAIFLIGILISSFLAISCDSAAYLNVRSRPQGNCGDGIIQIIDTWDRVIEEVPIKKGSDLQGKIKLNESIKRIAFHSPGRGNRFNANIKNIPGYLRDTENPSDINVDVNFYKKSGYGNMFWFNAGNYSFSKVDNVEWSHNYGGGGHWYWWNSG